MHVIFLNPQGNFDQNDSYLTEHPDFGGQLVYVKELSLALAEMGIKVDIVTRRIDDPTWSGFTDPVDYYPDYEDNPRIVRITCGGSLFLNKECLWPHLEEFVSNTLAFYGPRRPDFATAHYADGGYCCALLSTRAGLGFTFTGHSLGAQKLDKLGATLANIDAMEQQFHFSQRIAAERLSMRRAVNIITSTAQERYEQYAHPLYEGAVDVQDDDKFSVIPPGVNTRIFTTQRGETDDTVCERIVQKTEGDTAPYIIASSRLDKKKNILGLVKAYAQSEALQGKARLGLFVRGVADPFGDISLLSEAEREVLGSIRQTIEEAKIKHKVDFFDLRSQRDLAAAYRYFSRQGSVFALTAFHEPFGLGPIEAAACGLPVVATRNGGPSEIFADGSGVLVDPSDEPDIARGLLACLAQQSDYAKRGRRRVNATYTWQQTALAYRSLIERGLGAQPKPMPVPQLDSRADIIRYLAVS